MDTFMDKLASKFNAQEMIRANSAAEAKENERLHKEVEVYKQCLQEMREITLQNSATADEVAELVKTSMDKIAAIQAESGKSEEVLATLQSHSDTTIAAVRTSAGEILNAVRCGSEDVINAVSNQSDVLSSTVRGTVQSGTDKLMSAIEGSSDKIVTEIKAQLENGNDGFKDALKAELLAEIKRELKNQEENVHKECVKVYRNVQAVVTDETAKQTEEIVAAQGKSSKKASAALVCGILAMSFAALGLIVSVLDIFGVFAMLF